jgi:hypothetical protein
MSHRRGSNQCIRQFHRMAFSVPLEVQPRPTTRLFIDQSTRQRQKETSKSFVLL